MSGFLFVALLGQNKKHLGREPVFTQAQTHLGYQSLLQIPAYTPTDVLGRSPATDVLDVLYHYV